jgi:Protein of unknown function (DUF4238)
VAAASTKHLRLDRLWLPDDVRSSQLQPALSLAFRYAFDKWDGRQFQVAVKDAAAEHGYNSFETDQVSGCVEEYFTEIETAASPFIQEIVSDRRLPALAPEGRTAVARLAVAQMVRSKNHRAVFDQIGRILRKLAQREGTPEFQAWVGPANPAADRQALLTDLEQDVQHYLPHLLDKDLVLFCSTDNRPLLIGDSPLIRTNTLNVSELRGTTGLASPGVEIYLPLSPTLALAFMCPTLGEMMRLLINTLGESADNTASSYLAALESHQSLAMAPPNIDFLNSQQVIAAERFIYSGSSDFALVCGMLESDPTLRRGKRMTTNQGTFGEE